MDIRKWWKAHKYDVLCIGTLLLTTIGIGAAVYSEKKRADAEAEEAMKRLHETIGDLPEIKEQTFEEKQVDPERQLECGGWFLEDWMYEHDMPELVVNDVPLSSLGAFGEEVKKRYMDNFPDWKETGMMDPDRLLTSIDITVEHVYLDENGKEIEEKKEDKAA